MSASLQIHATPRKVTLSVTVHGHHTTLDCTGCGSSGAPGQVDASDEATRATLFQAPERWTLLIECAAANIYGGAPDHVLRHVHVSADGRTWQKLSGAEAKQRPTGVRVAQAQAGSIAGF